MSATKGLVLMECLNEIDDPRKASNGTRHDFREMLVMAIAGVLSDCDSVEDVAAWAQSREQWLRRFLVLKNGVPSEDTFLRLFRLLDPGQFEASFRRWVTQAVPTLAGTIAVDGKTVRGSGNGGEDAIHLVSAFATQLGIALGQEKVCGKSNEITAIPELLEALAIDGFLVSIDAMGCQRAIARKIIDKKADYLLAVKGNQPKLFNAIQGAFIDRRETAGRNEHVEKSHGRVVAQIASILPAEGVVVLADWPECAVIGRIDSVRQVTGKAATLEQRYYIASRALTPEQLAQAARSHWGIENQLHWMLDVTMGEDGSTVREDHAPQNLSLLKKIVLNLIRLDKTDKKKCSLRLKRKRAAWDDEVRMNMLGFQAL